MQHPVGLHKLKIVHHGTVGIGFGESYAARYGVCMFGARRQLPADLWDLVEQLATA